jgi:hypothetical protein
MVGKGAMVCAVWGYVIAKQTPDRTVGSQVRLHPVTIGAALGETPEDVERAIAVLCSPDPSSTSPEHDGRRLIKIGTFEYQVVNGAKYRAIRDEETRREQCRLATRKYRAKKTKAASNEDHPTAFTQTGASPEEWRKETEKQSHPTNNSDSEF